MTPTVTKVFSSNLGTLFENSMAPNGMPSSKPAPPGGTGLQIRVELLMEAKGRERLYLIDIKAVETARKFELNRNVPKRFAHSNITYTDATLECS